MLRIVQSKSAKAAKDYFRESLQRPDYYGAEGQTPGVWFGEGAARLGLEGEVSQEDFFALADNKRPANDNDPEAGQRLTVRDKANRRPGYDFVFSPSKSFSSLWARATPELRERLMAEFRDSVIETIREDIEPEMKTRLRRQGQKSNVVTGNVVGSLFLHDTTRPLADGTCDPHVHGHAYFFNATWAEHEKRWQAAELGDLHLDRPYFEAAFEARLAKRLEAMSLPVERRAEGWEIKGIPQSVLDKDSRRTAEIEAEAKRRNITDPAEKGELGAKTRRRKEAALSRAEVERDWDSRLTDEERRAIQNVWLTAVEGGGGSSSPRVTAGQAMEHAVGHVFVRDSAVSEKEVLAEALRYGVGSLVPEDVKKERHGHGLITATIDGRQVATTEAVLAEEQAMVAYARDGRGRCSPLSDGTPHVFKRKLDDGQKEAVRQLLASIDRNRVSLFIGKAGVGKTTTVGELGDVLEERGRKLLAFAPTSRASRGVLRQKGFPAADTLAQLLRNEELQEQVRGNVILIDEIGLAGTTALRNVFALAEKQQAQGYDTRIVVTGDPQQHRGVPRGSVINILQDHAGLEPVKLMKIRRQEDPDHRAAIEDLSEGLTDAGFAKLDKRGFVVEIEDPEERYQALAREFVDTLDAGQTALILSPTHAEGRAACAAVREELRGRDQLGAEDRSFVRYERKDLTAVQLADAVQYQPGDMVQWHDHAPGFKSGSRVRVVDREDGVVRVENAAGQVRALPLQHAARFELYRTSSLPVAERERLRITRNGYTADEEKHRLNNGDLVTVTGFTPNGDIIDERGWVISKEYGHLAAGILTSHASQGMDEDWCFVAQSSQSRGASSAQQFYVSASRGRTGVRFFTDDKEALRKAVARSDVARSATAVWQAQQAEQAEAARELVGQRRWRQRYLAGVAASRQRPGHKLRERESGLRERSQAGEERPREVTYA